MSDLLYSDPQWLEMMTQGWLTITAEALVCFCDRFRVFPSIATHGLSSKWHTVVLPGAISRLCSVSPRQIPVWDTDTPPYLSKTPASLQWSLPRTVSSASDHKGKGLLVFVGHHLQASGEIQSNNQNKQINKTNTKPHWIWCTTDTQAKHDYFEKDDNLSFMHLHSL